MKFKLYSIVDRKKSEMRFSTPFCAENDDDAKRSFQSFLVNNRIIDASDFELMCVGSYDSSDGKIGDTSIVSVMNYDTPEDTSAVEKEVNDLKESVK